MTEQSHADNLNCAMGADGMDRFSSKQNLERFRRLASGVTNEAERTELLELLATEYTEFIEQQTPRTEAELAETAVRDVLPT